MTAAMSGIRPAPTEEPYYPYLRTHWRNTPRHPTRGHFIVPGKAYVRKKQLTRDDIDRIVGMTYGDPKEFNGLAVRLRMQEKTERVKKGRYHN